jgi:hypothetical protein
MSAVQAITEKLLGHCRALDQRIKFCRGRNWSEVPTIEAKLDKISKTDSPRIIAIIYMD